MTYSQRYSYILSGEIKDIDKIPAKTKNNAVKALIVLSKYLGIHEDFKTQLKSYGIKLSSADAFSSLLETSSENNKIRARLTSSTCIRHRLERSTSTNLID
jgi:hypothetical protein